MAVLEQHMLPSRLCVFQQSVQNHILQLLQQHSFVVEEYVNWPANNPDLSPIENIWCIINVIYVKDDHELFSKNGTKLQHQNSRNS